MLHGCEHHDVDHDSLLIRDHADLWFINVELQRMDQILQARYNDEGGSDEEEEEEVA
jgi:hypothetical protein